MRAIIYRRLSVLRESDPTLSPNTQEQACRAFAEQQGWSVVGVVDDMDESASSKGKRLQRPGLLEAIGKIESGEADVLLASRLDRIARSARDGLELSERVPLATVKEGFTPNSAQANFQRTLWLSLAELESATISERVKAGVKTSRSAGRWTSARIPYGYETYRGPDGGTYLRPLESEASVIRDAAARLLAGETLTSIVKDLNLRGVPTKLGGIWRFTTLQSILTSPLVGWGFSKHNGALIFDAAGDPLKIAEPILDPVTAEELAARFNRPKAGRRSHKARSFLSGLLYCATCGTKMSLHSHTSGKEKSFITDFACSSQPGVCSRKSTIRKHRAEKAVVDQFLSAYGSLPFVRNTVVDTTEQVAIERAKRQALLDDLLRRMVEPDADVASMVGEIEAAKAALNSLEAGGTRTVSLPTGNTVAEAWESLSDDDRFMVLSAGLYRVTVFKGEVTLEWRE